MCILGHIGCCCGHFWRVGQIDFTRNPTPSINSATNIDDFVDQEYFVIFNSYLSQEQRPSRILQL